MPTSGGHLKGIGIVTAGVLILSPDSLVIRMIEADTWILLFWRNLLMSVGLIVLLLARYREETWAVCRATGRFGIWAGIYFGLSSIFFVAAITHTLVANVLVIISLSPLLTAIFGRIFLKEPVPVRTWLAIAGAVGGIVLIFLPNLDGSQVAGQTLIGDLSAVGTAVMMAAYFTVVRRARDIDMTPGLALSGILASLAVLPLAGTVAVSAADAGWLALLGLFIAPVSFALISMGPRYMPAAETSLLLLLETALGPLWVWWALDELPGPWTFLGGAVVIGVLIGHATYALHLQRQRGLAF